MTNELQAHQRNDSSKKDSTQQNRNSQCGSRTHETTLVILVWIYLAIANKSTPESQLDSRLMGRA